MRKSIILGLSLCAGSGDLFTGLLLVFAPAFTLGLMRVPVPADLVFLRFVGCFVAAVGLSYFLGLASWWKRLDISRLRACWELTIAFRLAAAAYVAWQVWHGALTPPWLSVPIVDGFWGGLQMALLQRGIFEEFLREQRSR
jgi:hypothetical protein